MKKIAGVILVFCLVMGFLACQSKPEVASSAMPPYIQRALNSPPENGIVAVGSARMQNTNMSRTTAAGRARAELSNTLNSFVTNMFEDFWAASEVDPQAAMSYQQNVTQTLSRSQLSGAQIIAQEEDREGEWWVVMLLSSNNVINEINAAQAAARLAIPAAANQIGQDRMQEAIQRAVDQGMM